MIVSRDPDLRRGADLPYNAATAVKPGWWSEGEPMLRTVEATRYVTPLREGGSLPAIVEADDLGLYVVKFRGAGQGPKALVAEVVAGQIGQALGLAVPDIVAVEISPALGRNEPDPEIQDLLAASTGLNAGLDYLPGALAFVAPVDVAIDPALAADIVWFDAFVSNVDRTPRNPNLLLWHRKLWLIDHGAALYLHHSWTDPLAVAGAHFAAIKDHILFASAAEHRATYVAYLLRRLELSAGFVEEAEQARRAHHAG
jgi:hypothetical protein